MFLRNDYAIYVYTDGNGKQGWGYITVDNKNTIVQEACGRHDANATSEVVEEKAVMYALKWVSSNMSKMEELNIFAVILSDCLRLITKVQGRKVEKNWLPSLNILSSKKDFELFWMYVPAHAGVTYNERADELASLGSTKETTKTIP